MKHSYDVQRTVGYTDTEFAVVLTDFANKQHFTVYWILFVSCLSSVVSSIQLANKMQMIFKSTHEVYIQSFLS